MCTRQGGGGEAHRRTSLTPKHRSVCRGRRCGAELRAAGAARQTVLSSRSSSGPASAARVSTPSSARSWRICSTRASQSLNSTTSRPASSGSLAVFAQAQCIVAWISGAHASRAALPQAHATAYRTHANVCFSPLRRPRIRTRARFQRMHLGSRGLHRIVGDGERGDVGPARGTSGRRTLRPHRPLAAVRIRRPTGLALTNAAADMRLAPMAGAHTDRQAGWVHGARRHARAAELRR